jgi:hypothetical protein
MLLGPEVPSPALFWRENSNRTGTCLVQKEAVTQWEHAGSLTAYQPASSREHAKERVAGWCWENGPSSTKAPQNRVSI